MVGFVYRCVGILLGYDEPATGGFEGWNFDRVSRSEGRIVSSSTRTEPSLLPETGGPKASVIGSKSSDAATRGDGLEKLTGSSSGRDAVSKHTYLAERMTNCGINFSNAPDLEPRALMVGRARTIG